MDIYIVRPGDTLSHIANFCGLSLDELLKINPQIDNPGLIFPGQEINIKETVTDDDFVPPEIPESDAPWFKIALEEMWAGVTEIRGRKHNPRIIEYHKSTTLRASNDETAWCSSFVNWCIEQAGLKGTDSAAARSWLKWGKKLDSPKQGCVAILKRGSNPSQGHVAFYFDDDGSRILLLGGNQSNRVKISSYPKSKVLGWRWAE